MSGEPTLLESEIHGVHFTSRTDEWATPQPLFDHYNRIYAFTLDVCATPENAKCDRHFTREDDGLARSWAGERCWMNPPYGRTIGDWMRKAYTESLAGSVVVCLVPARVDTRWWHNFAMNGNVSFLKGRVAFRGSAAAGHNAPFPSAVVVFTPPIERALYVG